MPAGLDAFLLAFGLIFVAELGDKTQLLALALAARHPVARVLLGVAIGTFAINLVSVLVGEMASLALPKFWIDLVAGIAFIGFGLWTLRPDDDDDDDDGGDRMRFGVVFTAAMSIFLAELGDKTMLATITLAGQRQQFVAIWLGASLGMFTANAAAVLAGGLIGSKLPEKAIRVAAALAFLATGAWILIALAR